jgi:probable HAF family extracellular repeat protein
MANIAGAAVFHAIDLGALPTSLDALERSEAYAINDLGQIVGNSSATNSYRAVQWSTQSAGSQMTDLGVLPDMRSAQAFALNDRGQTVGISVNGDRQRAFLWNPTTANATTGTLVELNNLHGERNQSRASSINNAGQVVGITGGDAFLWTPFVPNGASGEAVDLGDLLGGANVSYAADINATGHVVGASVTDFGDRAFLWSPIAPNRSAGRMTDLGSLAENGRSFAAAINDAGAIVGSSATTSGGDHAVLWSAEDHAMTDLGDLPGGLDESAATDINVHGHVVGHSNSAESEHPFLWTPSDGMRDLNAMLDATSDAAWTLYYAQSINDAGHIVGWGDYDPDGAGEQFDSVIHAYLLAPVTPTPGDFNGDGATDAADLAVWTKGFGESAAMVAQGDADLDGDVDGADLLTWQRRLGENPAVASAVPEPSTILLSTAAIVCALSMRRSSARTSSGNACSRSEHKC